MSSENKSKVSLEKQSERQKNLPIVSSEDVEFSSEETMDSEDFEAQARAAKANNQQNNSNQ